MLSEPFVQLPTRRDLPDYYELIKRPMDLKRIQNKIRDGKYSNLDELQADVELMCRNTQEYNIEGSLIFEDSIVLNSVFKSARARLEQEPMDDDDDEEEDTNNNDVGSNNDDDERTNDVEGPLDLNDTKEEVEVSKEDDDDDYEDPNGQEDEACARGQDAQLTDSRSAQEAWSTARTSAQGR